MELEAVHAPVYSRTSASGESRMASERVKDFLPRTRLSRLLTPAEIDDLAEAVNDVNLDAGERLFEAGEDSDGFYALESGSVAIIGRDKAGEEHVIAELEAPTIIGEMEVLTGSARYASVEARSDCRFFQFEHERFRALVDAGNVAALRVVVAFAEVMAERLHQMNVRLTEKSTGPAAPREELAEFKRKLLKEWSF